LTALLLISIGILALGIIASVLLVVRSGEIRVGFLTLCFSMLGTRQGLVLWNSWTTPLSLETALGPVEWTEVALVVGYAAAVAALGALWKTFAERDRAESLHWDSMEAVRVLSELAVRWDLSLDDKLAQLLKIGCERFGLEIGAVSRIEAQRYEIIAIRAPADFGVARGAVFLLADTLCGLALDSKRPVTAIRRVIDAALPAHAERAPFEFASYLGAQVRVCGETVGTLSFGERAPRRRRFTATDKDLAGLMAQWVGTELERRLITEERKSKGARKTARMEKPAGAVRLSREIDVNAAIRRSDKHLRAMVGPDVAVDYFLADDLHTAIRLHVTVGAIIESLTHEATDILTEGGRLSITTANLQIASQGTNVVPAVAPNHYITVALEVASPSIQAESLNRAFEPSGTRADEGAGWELQKHLTISSIYRLLQRSGGDLSLAVEPGVDATFTIFLPRAASAAAKSRKALKTGLPAHIQ